MKKRSCKRAIKVVKVQIHILGASNLLFHHSLMRSLYLLALNLVAAVQDKEILVDVCEPLILILYIERNML